MKLFNRIALVLTLLLLSLPAGSLAFGQSLTLGDCIALTLKENRTIKNAYLDRVVQKYDLRMAEETFTPTLKATPSITSSGGNGSTATTTMLGTTLTSSQNLPTGGSINLSANQSSTSTKNASPVNSYGWNINLTQPLLKGGGLDVGLEPLRLARINEQKNILNLKSTLMSTLTTVISAYRNYVKAIKSLEISKQSLKRSKDLIETNREMIAAGRMAAVELVQSEADLARQEFDLLSAENSLDKVRLELTKAIDIDKNSKILPQPETNIPPVPYALEQAKQLAFDNRPEYLTSLLSYENEKRALILAKNRTLWNLNLTGGYSETYTRGYGNSFNSGWNTGLALTIPLDDLYLLSSDRKSYLAEEITMKKMENDLARQREDIEIAVQDAMRNAEMSHRQIKLATLSRTLSEKKVEIETEKLKAGRSTNFQLVSFQNDLKNAQDAELSSITDYLNALTNLDNTLGITLDTLKVSLVERN